ncbi:RNA polymerase sigma-70 factor [Chitinophaga sp. CB10]|uniref:RNA polymerase sigma-70 factor n=1 Tax=Chitinophaga sp. CB10 TaxID=1891659 RepID=UPI0025C684DE|nr:RNA polymerase sigma-70 factor [Chitinophaga sp. CB10]
MYQPNSIEPASFEELFRSHYSILCATAYYVLEDEDAAKDIVQDFFLYCWDKRNIIRITQNFRNYATRAVRNACLNYLKKNGKVVFNDPAGFMDQAPDTADDKELEESRHAALWAAIGRLPVQRRRIFLLSNRDELSYRDIAGQLNISVNTVKTQIKLAYQFLRKECEWMFIYIAFLVFLNKGDF